MKIRVVRFEKLLFFNINFLSLRTGKIIKFPENNIVTGILPMSHSYGLFVNLLCLVLDHRYILIKRYTEKSFLSYIQQYKVKIRLKKNL